MSGCAVLLTNERLYWNPPNLASGIDLAFCLHEGRRLSGTLSWAVHTAPGTMVKKEAPLALRGSYTLHWREYSAASGVPHAEFKYLLVTVERGALGRDTAGYGEVADVVTEPIVR